MNEITKVREQLKSNLKLNEQLKTEQKTVLKELFGTKEITKLRTENISPKKTNKIIITIKNEGIKTKKQFGGIDEELFKVFGRRYGKFKELKSVKSKEEAERFAKEFSVGTLGASTKIEKGGKPIEFSLGTGFRKSKREPFVIVQERGQRLGSYGERTEIKRSRKRFSFL
jgi:hypothetical protein